MTNTSLEEEEIFKLKKPDLDLEPGFMITAEYRLGEIRGFNIALDKVLALIRKRRGE